MLTTVLLSRAQCVVVAFLSLTHSLTAQYDSHYKVKDDEGSAEDESPTDYTKYFSDDVNAGTVGRAATAGAPPPNPDASGFVQPLDFAGFFSGGQFGGFGSLSEGTNNHPAFRNAGSTGIFPVSSNFHSNLETSATNNNNSYGFVEPNIQFRSFFDTANAASDVGFRSQDFIPKGEAKAPSGRSSFFTPAFASLKKDVDRGVVEQQREEATALSSKASGNQRTSEDEYDDEDEGGADYSDDVYGPRQTSDDRYVEDSRYYPRNNGQPLLQRTPYGQVKKPIKSAPVEHQSSRPAYQQKSSPTRPEPDYGYASPFEYRKGYDYEDDFAISPEPKNRRPLQPVKHNQSNKKPLHQAHYSGSYSNKQLRAPPPNNPRVTSEHSNTYPGNRNYRPDVKPRQYVAKNSNPSEPYNLPYNPSGRNQHGQQFRPSPNDPYLDTLPTSDIESSHPSYPGRTSNPISAQKGIYSLPQTEYASVIPKNEKPHENEQNPFKDKVCTKIQKKINPTDVDAERYGTQTMVCYICNNPKTNRKYEECSYELNPRGKTVIRGNSESYSSDTNIKPYIYHTRPKRFVSQSDSEGLENDDLKFNEDDLPFKRVVRQYSEYDGSYYGHDDSNYRFGPEHFTDDGAVEEGQEQGNHQGGNDGGTAEGNESCTKVKKDGLICMVCKNVKTAGSYEQCSYASDPEENRYSYGVEKTYGSQTPDVDRYKRRVDNINEEKRKVKKNPDKYKYKKGINHDNLKLKGDFKYGKIKRKKVTKQDYDIPVQFAESVARREKTLNESKKRGGIGLDPYFYGSPDPPYIPESNEKRSNNKRKENTKGPQEAATSNENEEEEIEDSHDEEDEDTLSYEDYFLKLFPELANEHEKGDRGEEKAKDDDYFESTEDEEEEETKESKKKVVPGYEYHASHPDYFDDSDTKKDLAKVLGEFTQKDRSDCKKVMRDKMTCYQCKDKKGMQHEECMFVAASEPKSKHLAYHEVKEFRINPDGNKEQVNSKVSNDKLLQTSPITFEPSGNINTSLEEKTKHIKRSNGNEYSGGISATNIHPVAAVTDNLGQSAEVRDILKLKPLESKVTIDQNKLNEKVTGDIPQRVLSRKKRLPSDDRTYSQDSRNPDIKSRQDKNNYSSVPPEKDSFEVPEGPEGAYSHETEPVFDSVLKMSLPKYMLQRSEHEAIFDEVLASG